MKNIWLMCGVPGSGKSTYLKKLPITENDIIISRDAIRFQYLNTDEDYFSHETEVFKCFLEKIQEAINDNAINNIYVDATHLNQISRNKVLDKLNLDKVENINCINMLVPVKECIEHNNQRTGRERVPVAALMQMAKSFYPASYEEKYKYNTIINVGDINE